MHFRISYTMKAEDIFRSSIGCEIMLMIKARIRLIFTRYMKFSCTPGQCYIIIFKDRTSSSCDRSMCSYLFELTSGDMTPSLPNCVVC